MFGDPIGLNRSSKMARTASAPWPAAMTICLYPPSTDHLAGYCRDCTWGWWLISRLWYKI